MLGADEKQCPEAARPNNNAWAVPAHKGEGDTNREDCAELVGKWVRQKKKNKSGLIINSSFSHPVGFISQTQAGTREPARAADPNICQAGGGSRLASPSVSGPLTYVLAYA